MGLIFTAVVEVAFEFWMPSFENTDINGFCPEERP